MSYVVFWLQDGVSSQHQSFSDLEVNQALALANRKRGEPGVSHVSLSSEMSNQVGARDAGGSVENGRLPDGTEYTWKKRRL